MDFERRDCGYVSVNTTSTSRPRAEARIASALTKPNGAVVATEGPSIRQEAVTPPMASVFAVMIPGTRLFSVKTLDTLATDTFGFRCPRAPEAAGERLKGHRCAKSKPGI